jgi:hypothetical protein
MVKVFIKPNRKGLSSIKRVSLREPFSREYLIDKTIPYDSYVAKRMRELGVYDMGLSPLQISSVQKDLNEIYVVKKSLDKKDVDEAVERARQNQLARETKAVLGEVRDYQKQLVELKKQKNDLNPSKLIGKTETGLQVNEKELLSRPQEQMDTRERLTGQQQVIGTLEKISRLAQPSYAGDEEVDFGFPLFETPPPLRRSISATPSLASQAEREEIGRWMREEEESMGVSSAVSPRPLPKKRIIKTKLRIIEKQEGEGMMMRKVVMPNPKMMRPPILHPMSLRY